MTNPTEPPDTASAPSSAELAPAPPGREHPPQSWLLLSLMAAGLVAGALFVIFLKSSGQQVATAPRGASPARASDAASGADAARDTTRPRWSGGVRRSNGRNVAVYELEAENDVALWGKIVRPVLTVRCVAGATEVFVLTQSAAAIDGTDGRHAVRVGYDREPDGSERWLASDEYDALFAENGVGAAKRIAAAHTMRFGFTPYNASPVVARFEVAGFDSLAPRLAQTCRW